MTTNDQSIEADPPSLQHITSPLIIRASPTSDGTIAFEIPVRVCLAPTISLVTTATENVATTSIENASAATSTDESIYAAKQAAAPVITYQEFIEMVDDPEITAQQLAPYFVRDESLDQRLDPGFRIHPGRVIMDPDSAAMETAGALNIANWIEKKKRQQRYVKQIRENPSRMRVVSEGDSWFQYPFMLYDVIDHLMDRPELGIFCCSEAGDVISSMLPKGEFYVPIQREDAKVFLFSGGGNDLVDGAGLRRFLRNLPAGSPAKDHFTSGYRQFMANIAIQYETLFTRVLRHKPDIHIICHGYSDAVPQPGKGKWLGKPMSEIGITDARTQFQIVEIILNDLNEILERTAAKFGGSATHVDLRGIVPANGWHDEFHPTSYYYGKASDPIYLEILKHR